MSGRNWEPEDGMGFAGLVPTLAEKREEADRQRSVNREIKLREQLAASQREREQLQEIIATKNRQELQLQARVEAAEKLLRVCASREEGSEDFFDAELNAFLASPAAAPVQAEGEGS